MLRTRSSAHRRERPPTGVKAAKRAVSPSGRERLLGKAAADGSARELRTLEQLNESALRLLNDPGDDITVTITQVARELLGARYAALGLVQDGRLIRFVPDGMPDQEVAGIERWPSGEGLLGAMVNGRATIRVPDMSLDPRRVGFPAGHPPMQSFLGVPIQTADELYGSLYFTDKLDGTPFSILDERTAELFAAHAAIAIRDGGRVAALRASEDSLAEAQRVAHIGSWDWDLRTDALQLSDEAHRIYGYEPGSFLGTNESFQAFVHPDDAERVRQADRASVDDGEPYEITHRIIGPDGNVRTVHEQAEVIRDETGRPIRLVGTTQDVSERIRLESRQARMARLLDHVSSEIFVFDARTLRFTEANAGALRNLGYSHEELRQLTPVDLKPEFTAESFEALVRPLREGESSEITFSTNHRRKDGSLYPVEVRVDVVPNETPPVFIAVVRDITDQVAAETALRESERNLSNAQRLAHIGSFEWQVGSDETHWTDELHRIFGTDPADFAPSRAQFLDFVDRADRRQIHEADREVLRTGGPLSFDFRIVRRDGEIRLVREHREAISGSTGTFTRIVGTVQDITDQAAAEAERTRLVLAVEQTADSIFIYNLDWTIAYVNPSFTRLYGYAPEEIVGQHSSLLDSFQQAPAFWDDIWASVAAGRTWTGPLVNRRKDGSLTEVESVISPVFDAHGQLSNFLQTDRDVNRERALESALERDARERETIEAALEHIDPEATMGVIAATACAEILRLDGVDSAWLMELAPDHGQIIALAGQIGAVVAPGQLIPPLRARYLLERATTGSWVEEWGAGPELDNPYGRRISVTGLHTVAVAPLRGPHGVFAVIALGSHDPGGAKRVVERLPALTTFASILAALLGSKLEANHRIAGDRAKIAAILEGRSFTPFFQPIAEFHTGLIVGYEALTRFAGGTRPDLVFEAASLAGLGMDLEIATMEEALKSASVLPPMAYLSLNASPDLIQSGALSAMLAEQSRPLVLEITEHAVVENYTELRQALDQLPPTVRLAVDDAGAGYASLRHILELAPHFVKLDIGLVRGIDEDPARQALIAGMGYFAVKRKVGLVAEGVETEAELDTLRSLGVRYGQGYFLGRPQDSGGSGSWPSEVTWSSGKVNAG